MRRSFFLLLIPVLVLVAALVLTAGRSDVPTDATVASSEAPPSEVAAEAVAPRQRGVIPQATAQEAKPSSVTLPPLQGREEALLTYAPEVPAPIVRDHASRVVVNLTVEEKVMELADGVTYEFWTFGGEAPGPMIRVREGDLVEFNLESLNSSRFPHNIDLHAVTGPHGGGKASVVRPGESDAFSFRAIKPGLYVYHCAMAPVGTHVANGMYGLILVEPEEGLPAVDREYYVLQSEFYTQGAFGEKGLQPFALEQALDEEPAYVVFNGGVGALMEEGALQAATGETVRLFVGNAGPNLTASFHVIGEMFDAVYTEGGTDVNQHNVQTTSVPPGGAAIVDFEVDVPGTFALVDHAIFRAMNKGAVGHLKVVGPENPELFSEEGVPSASLRPDEASGEAVAGVK